MGDSIIVSEWIQKSLEDLKGAKILKDYDCRKWIGSISLSTSRGKDQVKIMKLFSHTMYSSHTSRSQGIKNGKTGFLVLDK